VDLDAIGTIGGRKAEGDGRAARRYVDLLRGKVEVQIWYVRTSPVP
jgi:hypothetical protein